MAHILTFVLPRIAEKIENFYMFYKIEQKSESISCWHEWHWEKSFVHPETEEKTVEADRKIWTKKCDKCENCCTNQKDV